MLADRLLLGRLGEIRLLDRGLGDGLGLDESRGGGHLADFGGDRTAVSNVLLCLGAVGTRILLHQAGSVSSLLASDVLDLVGLRVDDLLSILNVTIDDLAVADVDERAQVGDSHADQRQAPERKDLDKPVGEECSGEGL